MTETTTPRRHDATRQGLDRRAFVKLAVAGGAASLAAACGWDGGNAIRPRLLDISRINDWVGEKILFSRTRLAHDYSRPERSPSLPSYFISDAMPMPRTSYTVKHHCVEGWTAIASWAGVPVSAIVARCRPQPSARYIMFRSFD